MEEKVISILRTVLEDNSLNNTCSQDNCEAWDSLHHLTICFELEGEFEVVFEPDEMSAMTSVGAILKMLEQKLS